MNIFTRFFNIVTGRRRKNPAKAEENKKPEFLEMAFWRLEVQSGYADHSCVEKINDREYATKELRLFDWRIKEEMFEHFTPSSVGNIAYLASYSPFPIVRHEALQILIEYKEYAKKIGK